MHTLDDLINQLGTDNSAHRWQAVEALADFPTQRTVEVLISLLTHPDHGTRWRAVKTLDTVGGVEIIEPLVALLEDEKLAVRQWAARALVKRGDARPIEKILSTHQGIELLKLGPEINVGVVPFITHSDWKLRFVAARVLMFNDWQAADGMQAVQHAIALQEWDEVYKLRKVAIPFLETMLQDAYWEVRLCAARVLCQCRQVSGMQVLLTMALTEALASDGTAIHVIAQRILRLGDAAPHRFTEAQQVMLKMAGSNLLYYQPLPEKTVLSLLETLLDDAQHQSDARIVLQRLNTPAALSVLTKKDL